ncbi:hypothetical protein EX30DRAFT_396336 [Ascodesmis nigricans]|uniref:Zn(2)-C6 fungal-type domain-containing protein n=1 Tax=Ascodesmis nigricans TaxID=341454 RepID=A0A4S2MUN9_9PEZI|nr:hypothetical protein EX30DRAFT_396336 [Ascodesmis nigricans]
MVRPILPKHEREVTPALSASGRESTPEGGRTTKRRCISSACLPCRRRKSKCDGASPACSTCAAVYQMECVYDTDSDRRRKTTLKRDMEQLREKTDTLDSTIALIRSAPDEEVSAIVDHIRAHGSLQNLPDRINQRSSSEGVNDTGLLEVDEGGHLRHFGRRASLSAIHAHPSRPSTPRASRLREGPWTNVTDDVRFVSELISLYFTWHHPIHVLLSKNCFLSDMERRRSKYCSPLLVNAILALACHYTSHPAARLDPADPSTCGDHFFREAKALLQEEEEDNPSLTVVQALAIMSLREAGKGRDSSGWMYAGRAIRVALDLGLQVPITAETGKHFTHTEIEVRKITLWGVFLLDKLWCMQFGRLPELPSSFVGIPKPIVITPFEKESWPPYSESGTPSYLQEISIQSYTLAEILGQILFAQQSPREPPPSMLKVKTFHERLMQWREKLPQHLELHERSNPAVLCLHMFYYSTILYLFRPILMTPQGLSPADYTRIREICNSAANHLSNVFFHYQSLHYDQHPISAVCNMVLSAALYYLENAPVSTWNFEQCIILLRKLGKTWEVSNQALRALESHIRAGISDDVLVDGEKLLTIFTSLEDAERKLETERRSLSSECLSFQSGLSDHTTTEANFELAPPHPAHPHAHQHPTTEPAFTNPFAPPPQPLINEMSHTHAPLLPLHPHRHHPHPHQLPSHPTSVSPSRPRTTPPTLSLADHPAFTIDPTVPRSFLRPEVEGATAAGFEQSCQEFMKSLGVGMGEAPGEEEWLKGVVMGDVAGMNGLGLGGGEEGLALEEEEGGLGIGRWG